MWRRRILIGAAVALLLVLFGLGAVLWSESGPGLEREAARLVEISLMQPSSAVAEIGAGGGNLAALVAGRLSKPGRMWVTELDRDKLSGLRKKFAGLEIVTVVEGKERSAELPRDCCDIVYMRRVYHHFSAPDDMNRSLMDALRPGGRLVIIDMKTPRWLFFFDHGIEADSALESLASAGFVSERRIQSWSLIGYCLVVRKPDG